ncbi:MAG TPA: hypothetical protein PKC24_13580 [Cyclobacteriaceae bacterium]|nr:hypothetical protein [Cyclobacteriaceae bacterium]
MKHIEKRFLLELDGDKFDLNNETFEVVHFDKNFDHKTLNAKKNSVVFIITDKKKAYGGFVHKVEGKNYLLPVPDPTLIYFHNAQINIARIKASKADLLKKLDFTQELSETAIKEIYQFYGETTGFVIFLFTSMESFINQIIPEDYIYKKELPKRTEVYNKKQIQESIDFKTKITDIISAVKGKSFFANQTPTNQLIWNLKEFRDDIIHTKPDGNLLKYDKLIKTSLNFKYEDTLHAVAKFMNFYKTDYIIECDCGADF